MRYLVKGKLTFNSRSSAVIKGTTEINLEFVNDSNDADNARRIISHKGNWLCQGMNWAEKEKADMVKNGGSFKKDRHAFLPGFDGVGFISEVTSITELLKMNRILLSGNLGQDCEVKTSDKGNTFMKFSIADQQGDNVVWYNCVCFDAKAIEYARNNLVKGARAEIWGKHQVQTTDKGTYQSVIVTDIVSVYNKNSVKSDDAPRATKSSGNGGTIRKGGIKSAPAEQDDDGDPFLCLKPR